MKKRKYQEAPKQKFTFFTGSDYTWAISEDGDLYGWGLKITAVTKKLTTTTTFRARHTPQLVSQPRKGTWKRIYCGKYTTIGITSNDETFAWEIFNVEDLGNIEDRLRFIEPPNWESSENNTTWESFHCGDEQIIGKSSDGEFYTWHGHFYGTPELLKCPDDDGWKNVVCGSNFVIGVTNSGNMYSWKYNKYGQLGIGSDDYFSLEPQLVESPNQLPWVDAFCGEFHAYGITSDGKAFAWGYNVYGILGCGNKEKSLNKPHLLPSPNNSPWKKFVCGRKHTFGFTLDGEIFVWGYSSEGGLGINTMSPIGTPRLFSPQKDFRLKEIICGGNHTIGINHDDKIYVWGQNNYGQLGLGNKKDQYSPRLFSFFK